MNSRIERSLPTTMHVRTLQMIACVSLSILVSNVAHGKHAIGIQQNPTVDEMIAKARTALDNDNHKKARNELKAALKLRKDSAEALALFAEVCRREGKHDDAIKHAKEALSLQPEHNEASYILVALLLETRMLKDARDLLQSALNRAPQYAPFYILKGDFEVMTRRHVKGAKAYDPQLDHAIRSYDRALSLAAPDDRFAAHLRERIAGLRTYIDFVGHEGDPGYAHARPLNRPRPNYTEAARWGREEGMIIMGVAIDDRGQVTSVTLFSHLRYGLDKEAIRAARMIKFSPAMKSGKAAPYWTLVEIEFNLR